MEIPWRGGKHSIRFMFDVQVIKTTHPKLFFHIARKRLMGTSKIVCILYMLDALLLEAS